MRQPIDCEDNSCHLAESPNVVAQNCVYWHEEKVGLRNLPQPTTENYTRFMTKIRSLKNDHIVMASTMMISLYDFIAYNRNFNWSNFSITCMETSLI